MTGPDPVQSDFATLTNGQISVVLDLRHASPAIAYIGRPVTGDPAAMARALDWPIPAAGPDTLAPVTILPEASLGFPGRPGIEGHRADGSGWAPRMQRSKPIMTERSVTVAAADPAAGIDQQVEVRLDETGMITVDVSVTNSGDTPYQLSGVTMCVALANAAHEVMALGGRWSNEFRPQRHAVVSGAFEVENRAGRTSHDRFPALLVGTQGFSEEAGDVLAAHLGWSGNSRLRVEALGDGRRILQVGDALLPGEIELGAGEAYTAPTLYLGWSGQGLNGISDVFHAHIRARDRHPRRALDRCC